MLSRSRSSTVCPHSIHTVPLPISDGTEEDVWMYVDSATVRQPLRPVLDGEPSNEDIP